MQVITCNACKQEIAVGYGHPTDFKGSFQIAGPAGDAIYLFNIEEMKIRWSFDTTNAHFCRECLIKALAQAVFR